MAAGVPLGAAVGLLTGEAAGQAAGVAVGVVLATALGVAVTAGCCVGVVMAVGLTEGDGAGVGVAVGTALMAASAFTNPGPAQLGPASGLSPGSSPSGVAVCLRMVCTWAGVRLGFRLSIRPTSPATSGEEKEVPDPAR